MNIAQRQAELVDHVHGWYNIRYLPYFQSPKFYKFLETYKSIVKSIVEPHKKISAKITSTKTAFCKSVNNDPMNVDIQIPGSFLTKDPYLHLEDYEDAIEYYALVSISFLFAHESIHSRFTEYQDIKYNKLFDKLKNYYDKNFTEQVKGIAFVIANFYEDNAIHSISQYEDYYPHIENGIKAMIPVEAFDIAKSSVENFTDVIELLGFARNQYFLNDECFDKVYTVETGVVENLGLARDIMIRSFNHTIYNEAYVNEFVDNVFEIITLLVPNENDFSSKLNEEDSTTLYKLAQMELESGSIPFDFDMNLNFDNELLKEEKDLKELEFLEFLKVVIENGMEQKDVVPPEKQPKVKHRTPIRDDIKFVDLTRDKGTAEIPKNDPKFSRFANLLKQIKYRVVNAQPIFYRDTGKRVASNRLFEATSTGNIFGNKKPVNTNDYDLEIVIVGDMSGSMSYKNLYKTMLNALYSIAESLHRAGIKYGVYTHTTIGSKAALFFMGGQGDGFKRNQIGSFRNGFSNTDKIFLSGNVDSEIIEYVAEHGFSKLNNRKILMMLSDGQPVQGDRGYESGLDNGDYMKYTIGQVRKKGINVLGVALIKEVVETNKDLYGDDYTLDLSENLEIGLKRIIEKIQKG